MCRVEDCSAQSMEVAVPCEGQSAGFTSSNKLKFSDSLTTIHHNIRGLIDELICCLTSTNINPYFCLSEHNATEQNLLTLNLEN